MRVYNVEVAENGSTYTTFSWNIASRNFESVLQKVNNKIKSYKKEKVHLRTTSIKVMHLSQ